MSPLMVVCLVAAALILGVVVGRAGRGSATELPPAPPPAGDAMARIRMELANGNKIQAIKLYREATGAGLREAKDAVEAMERGAS